MKLGEINVQIKDQNGQPVPGVLLSLSGESGKYRSNNQTDANGKFVFLGLFTGSYHLRPLLKEFEFEPKSKSISYDLAYLSFHSFDDARPYYFVFIVFMVCAVSKNPLLLQRPSRLREWHFLCLALCVLSTWSQRLASL